MMNSEPTEPQDRLDAANGQLLRICQDWDGPIKRPMELTKFAQALGTLSSMMTHLTRLQTLMNYEALTAQDPDDSVDGVNRDDFVQRSDAIKVTLREASEQYFELMTQFRR